MDYKSAIQELDKIEDEGSRFKEIYSHFGLAVFNAQLLEQQAINLLVFSRHAKNKSMPLNEINALWDEYDFGKRTLGGLLNEIQQHFKLTDEDLTEFKELLKLRNYITHDYFRHNSGIWYATGGLHRIIKDLYDFIERRKKFDIRLNNYIDKFMHDLGFTEEMVKNVMDSIQTEWEKKTIDDNHRTFHK